ncbi:MAG: GNAT family N-acetyltransferase [Bacteroidota bacterium]
MLQFNFHPFPLLNTERLVLRPFTHADAKDIFLMRSDPEAMMYIGRPLAQHIDEAHKLIQIYKDNHLNNIAVTWAICIKGSDRVIGTIGFWKMQPENHRAEIGYQLHKDFWRQGILTEAITTVLKYGFDVMHLHSVEAIIRPDNIASQKLLEKMHFVKEGHFRHDFLINGKYEDSAIYSLLDTDQRPN